MSKPYIVVGGKRHPIVHGIKLGKSAKFLDGYVKITAESIDAADKDHTHSQYITNITSKMITDALGYTPSENVEVIDNLESTSTDSALSANQGKALKDLVDAKQPKGDYASTSHTHDERYYTETEIDTKLSAKSNTGHTHAWNTITGKPDTFNPSSHKHTSADIESLDAAKITGKINIENLPAGALERCVNVTDDTARFALTSNDIQLGDTVKVKSTGLMYLVINMDELSSEAGYEPYVASSASSVPWSGVTGKPLEFTPSSHNHDDRYYTETEVDNKLGTKANANHSHSQYLTSINSKMVTDALGYTPPTTDTNTWRPQPDWNATSGDSAIKNKPTSMPSSDVYAWAKATSKPSYTADEVGALPLTDAHHGGTLYLASNGTSSDHVQLDTTQIPLALDILSGAINAMDIYQDGKKLTETYANIGHAHTKSDIGLGNVDNTADANKTVKNANAITGFTVVDRSSPSWGEFAQTAYKTITEWKSATEGGIAFADKDNTTSIQIDGYFYQNEGTYKVLDTNNFSDVAAKKYHTHTGFSNGANYSAYGGNDTASEVGGGLNNLVFSSWQGVSFTTNCTGQTYYNKTAVSIDCRKGRLTANTIGTAGAMECSDMTIKTASTGIKLKNGYTYPARIYVEDKTLKIMSIGTSSGISANWGAGLAISTCSGGIYPIYNYNGNAVNSSVGVDLGTPTAKFGSIYSESTNSDKKLKKDIKNLKETDLMNKYLEMFNKIDFVKFRWKNNQNSGLETPASSRYHYGIIAQEIEKLLNDEGIGTYDNGIIKSAFFAENTSGAFVTGGYQPRFENKDNGITYDYSENVYNFKHGYDYKVYNEIVEKNFSEINSTSVYTDRNNISYIMFEDNSKLAEGNSRPPVTIKGIILTDKDGNMKKLSMDYNKCISYYEWDDNDFSNPKTSGVLNSDGSITVSFNKKYGTYMIKVDNFNFFDYEKIILDVDYVGEYKVYLIPEATTKHVNANVWDRGRVDDIMLIYNVNYQELQIMCLFAAQQKIKQQESEISVLKAEIQEIKELLGNA